MKDLVPVFAAIAGGLLTALGTALIQRSARGAEQRKFLREQLERLYAVSSQLARWADQVIEGEVLLGLGLSGSAAVATDAMQRQERVARPTDEILMLSRFYHPTLAPRAEELDAKATQVADRANEFTDYIGSKPSSDPVDAARLNPASDARDALATAVRQFQEVLAVEVRRLI